MIELRHTPELRFLPDASFDEAQHIETLLHRPDVARDLAVDPDDEPADPAATERPAGD